MLTWVALKALHYWTFRTILYERLLTHLAYFPLATGQQQTLQTPLLLEQKHGMLYYSWIAVYYSLCLHEQLKRLCLHYRVFLALSSMDIWSLSVIWTWRKLDNYCNQTFFTYSEVVYSLLTKPTWKNTSKKWQQSKVLIAAAMYSTNQYNVPHPHIVIILPKKYAFPVIIVLHLYAGITTVEQLLGWY